MDAKPCFWTGTKLALIRAAGELFAEKGIKGASIRAIAEKGQTNVAAVNYHFGNKEKLHLEVMRYVLDQTNLTPPSSYLAEPHWFASDTQKARLIERLVRDRFAAYLSPDQPAWVGRFMMQSMTNRTQSLETVIRENMFPDHAAVSEIFQRCKPGLSKDEGRLWAFSFISQVSFFVFFDVPILLILGQKDYGAPFLGEVSAHVTKVLVRALGLRPRAETQESKS